VEDLPLPSRFHFLALAGLLASGLSHAQSSVQLYGVLDEAVGSVQASGGKRLMQLSSGNLTTSFWGVRGAEDLGGGLRAEFGLESYLRLDTGEATRYTGDGFFSRAASVGLANDLGALRLGRLGTPLFTNTLLYNPLAASFGFSPAIRNWFGAGAKVSGDTAWNNAVGYTTPTVGGFNAGLLYGLKETAQGANAGAGVNYSAGGFGIGLAGQRVKVPFAAGEETAWQLGSSYDFGPAKVFGQYGRVRETATTLATANTRDRITQVGVSVKAGAGSVLASWSAARTTGALDTRRTFVTVGYDYRLSRRTDVYAMAMSDRLTGQGRGTTWGLGVRHAF
jgi:predicted porin